jgi:hemerythrin-like domain-containing protein
MDKYLNTGVKDVIREFPTVGEILAAYGIGCVPCTAGSCLLKDVVDIHHLAPDAKAEMLARVAGVIYPDRAVDIPAPAAQTAKEARQISYSPPLQKLVNEHVVIKRWLALVPQIVARLDQKGDEFRPVLRQAVEFLRNYADAYHHAKEEEILFAGLDGKLDIIATMRQEHERARQLVQRLAAGIETSDLQTVRTCLLEHRELLLEHIRKEDEILYPWIDRGLSDTQVGRLFSRFRDVDQEFGGQPAQYEGFVRQTEQRLISRTS